MNKGSGADKTSAEKGKRKGLPFFCGAAGILILVVVLASALPVSVPRLFGYEIYDVVSGSMEPSIPVGSLLYVEGAEPEDLKEGEIVAFRAGDSVISHRVVRNNLVEGELTTKGDANAGEDLNAVPYDAVIGRVSWHLPVLGRLLFLYGSPLGKAYVLCFAACGVMLNLLAGVMRTRERRERESE